MIDETPAAYKDIDAVMAAQCDLVGVVHTLKQVVCVEGCSTRSTVGIDGAHRPTSRAVTLYDAATLIAHALMKRRPLVLPEWFDLTRYVNSEAMDAADWFLNLLIRNWLARNRESEERLSLHGLGTLLRRHDHEQVNKVRLSFFGREQSAPSGFLPLLTGRTLASGVDPLSVVDLYEFEGRLPNEVRSAGAAYQGGERIEHKLPRAFMGRVDHAFEPQMLGRFVRINMALPDDVLLEDLKHFLAREREELVSLGGKQPYRDAVRLVGKTRGRDLSTLSTIRLLPFLDIELWREESCSEMSDYALAKLIELDASRLKETRRYARLVRDELTLRAWLEPLVRGVPPKSKRK